MDLRAIAGALGGLYLVFRLFRRRSYQGGPVAWGTHPHMTRELLGAAVDVAGELGADVEDLLTVVASESSFISNSFPPGRAGGLIGFMPSTLEHMGRTPLELARETAGEQMRRDVAAYLRPYKGRLRDVTQAKLAVFFPKAMGAPLGAVIGARDGSSSFGNTPAYSRELYAENSGADVNRDGRITVGDIATKMSALERTGRTHFYGVPAR